jgi:hypothetical protein
MLDRGGKMRNCGLLLTAATGFMLGCSDSGTGPVAGDEGQLLAGQFERLADSVDAGGYSPAAEALRHAAQIVRLTGHSSAVSLTIDGAPHPFLAVAEQIDYPNLECTWPSDSGSVLPGDTVSAPPGDTLTVRPDVGADSVVPPHSGGGEPPPAPECKLLGTTSMRTVIAWEPEHMAEVVRIVASIGSNQAATGVPDVMSGLPSSTPPDSGSGSGGEPGGFPGFMGEYLVRDLGSWWAVSGNEQNDLVEAAGACTADNATFDWAEFACEAARYSFGFGMTVEPVRYQPLTGAADPPNGPEGSHTLSMSQSSIDGVRLTWKTWGPPTPLPPNPNPPQAQPD